MFLGSFFLKIFLCSVSFLGTINSLTATPQDNLDALITHTRASVSFKSYEIKEWAEVYFSEIKSIHCLLENYPPLTHVLVLSGRAAYDKTLISFTVDEEDDYNRVRAGIEWALNITKKKLRKGQLTDEDIEKEGPYIIYNGTKEHNRILRKVLDEGGIKDYPKSKFFIWELEEINTKGQLLSVQKGLKNQGPSPIYLGVVTHAYHLPRVARYFKLYEEFYSLFKGIIPMPVDPYFQALSSEQDMEGEINRLAEYAHKGDLAKEPLSGFFP